MPAIRRNACELEDVLKRLRANDPELFRSWFHRLRLTSVARGRVEISAQSPVQLRYLEARCRSAFTEAAQAAMGRLVSVSFTAQEGRRLDEEEEHAEAGVGRALSAALDPACTLERFVTGPGNQLAHSTAVAVAERPGETYNPVFVHGAAGVGKTHLLQGVARAAGARYGERYCRYMPCQSFIADAIRAIEHTRADELREQYGSLVLLALDDVHLLADRKRSQEALFPVLDLLSALQRQVVLSADRLPLEVAGLEHRLASRLGAGLVVALDAPDLETRMVIVREKAALLAIDLAPDVVRLVAQRYESDVRCLVEAVKRIDSLSGLEHSPITVELTERALEPGYAVPAGRKN